MLKPTVTASVLGQKLDRIEHNGPVEDRVFLFGGCCSAAPVSWTVTMLRMIEQYIPHRPPMRLIDRLIAADDEQVLVEADVPVQGRFVRDGAMPTWVGIEHMAQAIAAWAGARALRRGQAPKLGLLLGSRKFEMRRATLPSGSTLRIHARCELLAANGLGMFACRMTLAEDEVATALVSVFEPDDAMHYLAGSPS